MNTIFRHSAFLLFFAMLSIACSAGERGAEEHRTVLLPAGEIHEGWYFGAGDEVRIEGTVNGDVYVAGGNVDVGGTINGDLFVAGGMVTVDGTISENIRATGGVVRIGGKVGRSVTAAGGGVVITQSGRVQSYLLAAGGDVQIAGEIGKGVKVGAGKLVVTGTIGEELSFGGDVLTVSKGATVKGEVIARVEDPENVHITDGTVRGKVTIRQPAPREGGILSPVMGKVIWTLCLLFTGLVVTLLFPGQIKRAGILLISSAPLTLLWGILGVIGVPIAAIIIMVSVAGLPVGLFVLFLYLWFLYLSQVSLGVVFAKWVFRMDERKGWSLTGVVLLGVLVVQLVAFVPYVRIVIEIVSVVLGMGALLRLVYEAISSTHRTAGESRVQ